MLGYKEVLKKARRVRRRLRLGLPPVKKPREKRPRLGREELLSYLRESGFDSPKKLREGRKSGEPTHYDYVREFGSWSAVRALVFKPRHRWEKEYALSVVIEFGLWSQFKYRAARIARPDVIPSERYIVTEFGTFRNFFFLARCKSKVATLNRYSALRKSMGRIPTIEDCRLRGLNIVDTAKFLGGKRMLDRFVSSLERKDANKGRSP